MPVSTHLFKVPSCAQFAPSALTAPRRRHPVQLVKSENTHRRPETLFAQAARLAVTLLCSRRNATDASLDTILFLFLRAVQRALLASTQLIQSERFALSAQRAIFLKQLLVPGAIRVSLESILNQRRALVAISAPLVKCQALSRSQ